MICQDGAGGRAAPCGTMPARHIRRGRQNQLAAETIGPSHQLVADSIRSKISSGEYPVGAAIPSTPQLASAYGVSRTVIRQAVGQLQSDGILIGHSGKAVFVRATPEQAAKERQDTEALARQVEQLRGEVHELAAQIEDLKSDDVRDILGRLEVKLARFEADIADLYRRQGEDYPSDEDQQDSDGTAANGSFT